MDASMRCVCVCSRYCSLCRKLFTRSNGWRKLFFSLCSLFHVNFGRCFESFLKFILFSCGVWNWQQIVGVSALCVCVCSFVCAFSKRPSSHQPILVKSIQIAIGFHHTSIQLFIGPSVAHLSFYMNSQCFSVDFWWMIKTDRQQGEKVKFLAV